MFEKIGKKIGSTIRNTAISARSWIGREEETLSNKRGAGLVDIALGIIISVVLAIIVLEALKNLFSVDILPQVTDKIDGMWS